MAAPEEDTKELDLEGALVENPAHEPQQKTPPGVTKKKPTGDWEKAKPVTKTTGDSEKATTCPLFCTLLSKQGTSPRLTCQSD